MTEDNFQPTAMEQQQRSIFEELKQLRVNKKLSLEKIAEKSKINLKYLEAIEAGNLNAIPQVYDKLFFQTYLSLLKVKNPEQYLAEYRKLRKEQQSQVTPTVQKIKSVKSDPAKFTKLKQLYIIIPLAVIGFIIVILAISSQKVSSDAKEGINEISVRDVVDELEAHTRTPKDSVATPDTTKIIRNEVTVQLAAKELTWLRFIKDRADTTEYLLRKGEQANIQAESTLVFLVGNAAGLNFVINGKNNGILGNSNEVISYLKIDRSGIAAKRLKTVLKKESTNDPPNVN